MFIPRNILHNQELNLDEHLIVKKEDSWYGQSFYLIKKNVKALISITFFYSVLGNRIQYIFCLFKLILVT